MRKMRKQRMILIVLVVFSLAVGAVVMSQAPSPDEPPWYIEIITGLDILALQDQRQALTAAQILLV